MIAAIAALALASSPDTATLTAVLRAHQEVVSGHVCGEYERGPGCDCAVKAWAIYADLADRGIESRVVSLVNTRAVPYPDGAMHGHAVVVVGRYQLDPQSMTLERAGSWAPLWVEYHQDAISEDHPQ